MAAVLSTLSTPLPKVLFLTHSAGFVHDVVKRKGDKLSLAEEALVAAAKGRFDLVASQDCHQDFSQYAAVIFYTTGELKIDADALCEFVKKGGGFVGIHCATDTLYKHVGYSELIDGYFDGHPWHQKVVAISEDRRHPATAHLPRAWAIRDEIYQFKNWDRKNVHVLLSLDPASVDISKGKRADKDYALAWTSEFGKGRVFYTALGHGANMWRDPKFLEHVLGGLSWTLGLREIRDRDGFEPFTKQSFKKFVFLPDGGKPVVGLGDTKIEGKGRIRELPESTTSHSDKLPNEIEDAVLWLEWKGKLELTIRGTPVVRESADWSRLEIETRGAVTRLFVNGELDEELVEQPARGALSVKGETRGHQVFTPAKQEDY
jgi:hypothetical protein